MRARSDSRDRPTTAPWRLFEPHAAAPWPFFLDRAGACSYAGSRPHTQLIVDADGHARVWRNGAWHATWQSPIDAIAAFIDASAAEPRHRPGEQLEAEALPRTVGYLAYELGAYTEDVRAHGRDPLGLPLAVLSTYDRVDVWHPDSQSTHAVEFATTAAADFEPPPPCADPPVAAPMSDHAAASHYRRAFEHLQEAIAAGDIYQANLSRRIDLPFKGDASLAYARIRELQPVPHGAFLDLGARQILCNSPESFLRVRGSCIATSPIKGTRPRHDDPDADRRARDELAADPKERAEHLMIVDLERNDLGRVAEVGSVHVAAFADVTSYATLHHLVSNVRGVLRSCVGTTEILRATFPGGSITGAPKRRAMQLIAELEPQPRGIYTGSIGCWNGSRSCDLNVAIRTAVVGRGRVHYGTGGGIVADSHVETEWDETVTKARAFLETIHGSRS